MIKGFLTLIATFAWGIGLLVGGGTGFIIGIIISFVLYASGLADSDPFDVNRRRKNES